jgi:succinyl-CoA synthetase beta subunit
MLLLEHDGKQLLAARQLPVTAGVLRERGKPEGSTSLPPGPWVVKAQVPVGGRGKAGGIRMAQTEAEVRAHVDALLDSHIRGHRVSGCRVEQRIAGGHEAYLSLMVDPSSGGVRMLMSATGGVDIESLASQPGTVQAAVLAPVPQAAEDAARQLAERIGGPLHVPLADAARRLSAAFFDMEALLLEVNPLFVREDGSWIIGDAKVILDDNALARHQDLVQLVRARAHAYPEAAFKLAEDFDYVELDPHGEVGLVTTGAGLSMMLVDQMSQTGLRAFNFLDIRTGQMRGDPHRLLRVFDCMREGRDIKVLLVNVFAGITHLGEFARLLVHAIAHTPRLQGMPVVARLIGNGQQEAEDILRRAGTPVFLEEDLDAALARVAQLVKGARA